MRSPTSGKPSRTWFQLVTLPCESGPKTVSSSSTVRHCAQSFSGLTTTESASKATGSSMTCMPFSGAGLQFGVSGGAGCVPHLDFAGAHGASAGACAGGGDVDADVGVGDAELFCDRFADGEYGAGACDGYLAAKLLRRGLPGLRRRSRLRGGGAAAAAGQRERQQREGERANQAGSVKRADLCRVAIIACRILLLRCSSSGPGRTGANGASSARVAHDSQRAVNAMLT